MATCTRMWQLTAGVSCILAFLIGRVGGNNFSNIYPFGFFNSFFSSSANGNISTGFDQVFACTANGAPVRIILLLPNATDDINDVTQYLNDTIASEKATMKGFLVAGQMDAYYGVQVQSNTDLFVYGVDSYIGSTDGFIVPVVTGNNTEFYVAGWPGVSSSTSGLIIANVAADTCIEVYRITNGITYQRLYDIYLPDEQMISRIVFNNSFDVTGLYINSSKPVNVFSNTNCGQVPTGTPYCDFMAEHIPPVTELGTLHFVPPIFGRQTQVGYVVRVVATQPDTRVAWQATGTMSTRGPNGAILSTSVRSITITRSQFIEISYDGFRPMMINCSDPCVVMQYNKGLLYVQGAPYKTDPFMMLTVPTDHFVSASCFATANTAARRYDTTASPPVLLSGHNVVSYENKLSIVTLTTSVNLILLDGQPIPSSFISIAIGDYTVIHGNITHGLHSLSTSSTEVTFAAYAYGHLQLLDSSGYGYPVAYKVNGSPFVVPQQNATAAETRTASGYEQNSRWTYQQGSITSAAVVAETTKSSVGGQNSGIAVVARQFIINGCIVVNFVVAQLLCKY